MLFLLPHQYIGHRGCDVSIGPYPNFWTVLSAWIEHCIFTYTDSCSQNTKCSVQKDAIRNTPYIILQQVSNVLHECMRRPAVAPQLLLRDASALHLSTKGLACFFFLQVSPFLYVRPAVAFVNNAASQTQRCWT